jgi:hypothetical protein
LLKSHIVALVFRLSLLSIKGFLAQIADDLHWNSNAVRQHRAT